MLKPNCNYNTPPWQKPWEHYKGEIMKNKTVIIPLIALLFAGCAKAPEQTVVVQDAVINTATAQVTTYQPTLTFAGSVQPWKEANCGSVLPGKVEKLHVKEGESVVKDQLLAELSGELLAQAEIEYKVYQKDYLRVKRLFEKGSVSEVDYDHLKAEYESKYEKWQMLKKNTEIRAPFSGTVTEFLVQEGENYFYYPALDINYSHAAGVVRLMQLDPLKIEIEVNEQDLASIEVGSVATAHFAAQDILLPATVTAISPTLSHLSRTATVTLKIDNQQHLIKPGMYCSVEVQLLSQEVITIPRRALIQLSGTGNYFVFAIENNVAIRTDVSVQDEIGNQVAISGIPAGMHVA